MSLIGKLLGDNAEARPPVELRVNGNAFDAFESGKVELSMEQGSNSFSLEYVAEAASEKTRAIFEGDVCELAMATSEGPEVVISGYIDTSEDDDSPDSLRLTATGRSATCDLVDCSATFNPGRWTNATIEKIAIDLCLPFGVSVFIEGSVGAAFKQFSIDKGETVYDAIARAALRRGLFPYCVGGDLTLAPAGSTRTKTVLKRGERVLSARRSSSWAGRYSDYLLRAQARATDTNWGTNASQLASSVSDDELVQRERWRPLLIQADSDNKVELKTRARIECNTRAGRGMRVTCVVDGWETDEGTAWRPNTLVRFKNDVLGIDADLLVTTVRFTFGPNESKEAELEMTRPEAFDVANYPALGRGKQWT